MNDGFRVRTSEGAHVVRRSRVERTEEMVEFEHALMDFASRRGFPVPPIRTTTEGVLDLAIALLSTLVRPAKTMLDLARAVAFVAAYTTVVPIDASERNLLSWYLRVRKLKRALARHRYYRAFPHPSRAAKLRCTINLLRWLDEHEGACGSATTLVAEGRCA